MSSAATAQPHRSLHVIQGGRRDPQGKVQGEMKMNTYRFAQYPSNSSVASGVTMLVSAWFLVAAGAILADPPSQYTHRSLAAAHAQPVTVAMSANPVIAPQAHFTITVEASRSAS